MTNRVTHSVFNHWEFDADHEVSLVVETVVVVVQKFCSVQDGGDDPSVTITEGVHRVEVDVEHSHCDKRGKVLGETAVDVDLDGEGLSIVVDQFEILEVVGKFLEVGNVVHIGLSKQLIGDLFGESLVDEILFDQHFVILQLNYLFSPALGT